MASENNLTELRITSGDNEVLIKKEKEFQVAHTVAPRIEAQAVQPMEQLAALAEVVQTIEPQKRGNPIVSPIVGTFYSSPSPDADPYVKVGDSIKVGQVLCIIESMKLMNEIESEVDGKVIEICVENGEPIETGSVLMYIE